MTAALKSSVIVRMMIGHDLPQIVAIERHAYDDPWRKRDFMTAMQAPDTVCVVVELVNRIVGYGIYLNKEGRDREIISLTVEPEQRRRGFGTLLIREAYTKANKTQISVSCICRDGSLSSHLFLRDAGFKAVRVLRRHYSETGDDAYVFLREVCSDQP